MKFLFLMFITYFSKKTNVENVFLCQPVNTEFSSNNDNITINNFFELRELKYKTESGLDLKTKLNETEEQEQIIRINTYFYYQFLLNKLQSDISIMEKETFIEKNDILPSPCVNIISGGLFDDWEFPEFT